VVRKIIKKRDKERIEIVKKMVSFGLLEEKNKQLRVLLFRTNKEMKARKQLKSKVT